MELAGRLTAAAPTPAHLAHRGRPATAPMDLARAGCPAMAVPTACAAARSLLAVVRAARSVPLATASATARSLLAVVVGRFEERESNDPAQRIQKETRSDQFRRLWIKNALGRMIS